MHPGGCLDLGEGDSKLRSEASGIISLDLSLPHLSVVVPAYNEDARIRPSLERLAEYYGAQEYPWDITIVSDGSKDQTNAIVEDFVKDHPKFRLLAYTPNRGKGYAVRKGILEAPGEWILFCDADLATPQEETEKLLEHMHDGAEVAIGSRPLRDSKLEVRQPWYREFLGRCFKMFTRKAAQDIFARCKLDGFSFDFEALMIARDLGYRIDEVPIRWAHQEGSKVVLLRDGPRMLRDLVKLRLKGKKARLGKD
jgi:dolichyl-phosphate beta-glucosyltransferase